MTQDPFKVTELPQAVTQHALYSGSIIDMRLKSGLLDWGYIGSWLADWTRADDMTADETSFVESVRAAYAAFNAGWEF